MMIPLMTAMAFADVAPGPQPPLSRSAVVQTPLMRFMSRARQLGFQYQFPTGFREVAVIDNRDMLYDFAVADSQQRIEVRYALRPIDQADLQRYRDYVDHKLPRGTVVTDPNKRGAAELMAIGLNVSGGKLSPAQPLEAEMAQQLFAADGAQATTLAVGKSQFATGWKNILIVQFWKRDVGYAYLFFMYNDGRDLPADGFAYPAFRALSIAPPGSAQPQPTPHPHQLIPPT